MVTATLAPAAAPTTAPDTNHTVLQAGPQRAMVWGFANVESGGEVTVSLDGGAGVTAELSPMPPTAPYSDTLIWSVKLPAVPAAMTPHVLTVRSSDGHSETLGDVLFGDVWVW